MRAFRLRTGRRVRLRSTGPSARRRERGPIDSAGGRLDQRTTSALPVRVVVRRGGLPPRQPAISEVGRDRGGDSGCLPRRRRAPGSTDRRGRLIRRVRCHPTSVRHRLIQMRRSPSRGMLPCFFSGASRALPLQHRQVVDQPCARLRGLDHVVDEAAVGGGVRFREPRGR